MITKKFSFKAERLISATEEEIKIIAELDKKCFPLEMQYADALDYYPDMVKDKENIAIVLKEDDKVVGFLLAIKYSLAYNDLKNHDPDLEKDKEYMYIETIGIHPRYRDNGGFTMLGGKLLEEALKVGIKGFCMHVRTENNLSQIVQKSFGAKKIRSIDNWCGYGEQFDYLELAVDKRLLSNFTK